MSSASPNAPQVSIFMVDPPWPKRKGGKRKVRPNQDRELDYSTLTMSEITNLLVKDIFNQGAPDHSVFLWVIDEFLQSAEQLMDLLGYRLHSRLIWDKTNGVAPAFSVRFAHEYLLWFYIGKFQPIACPGKYTTVLREPARQHSRKPDFAYRMVEEMFPDAVKIDVFSREKRYGWFQFGNQVDYFTEKVCQ